MLRTKGGRWSATLQLFPVVASLTVSSFVFPCKGFPDEIDSPQHLSRVRGTKRVSFQVWTVISFSRHDGGILGQAFPISPVRQCRSMRYVAKNLIRLILSLTWQRTTFFTAALQRLSNEVFDQLQISIADERRHVSRHQGKLATLWVKRSLGVNPAIETRSLPQVVLTNSKVGQTARRSQ